MEASRIRAVLLLAALAVVQSGARDVQPRLLQVRRVPEQLRTFAQPGRYPSPVRCRASKSSARDDWIPHDLKPLQAHGDVQSKFVGDCFATINPTQGREGIWDGEVPWAQQLRILQEAIRVTPLLRAFILEENQDDVGLYDNSRPHDHNDRFVMHNHRHDLISLPLSGHQENIKYDETDDHDDDLYVGTYLKAKFYSALFQEDRKAKQVEVGPVKLKRTSYTVNQPWHMDAREIHRITWQVVDGVPVIA
ncbi:hypothetical protein PBRA_004600 [Plasmodiophora brassicae]|uniref:Uncharacterized protein n=1 Tax=Plasmodiophora brassicae TaxID=37360 RepID=A0A0G4ILC8_PLABS|nr:hypothetical protein PBRA_004600 [Plasmodiophora brassicae]